MQQEFLEEAKMRIIVLNDKHEECYVYDKSNRSLGPSRADIPKIVEILKEATKFIAPWSSDVVA
jgi:hypothetical protein